MYSNTAKLLVPQSPYLSQVSLPVIPSMSFVVISASRSALRPIYVSPCASVLATFSTASMIASPQSYPLAWNPPIGASPYFFLYFSTSSGYFEPISFGSLSIPVSRYPTAASPAASRNAADSTASVPSSLTFSIDGTSFICRVR